MFYSLSEQVEGVRFLYEATMGLRTPGMQGCILADEMVRVSFACLSTACWQGGWWLTWPWQRACAANAIPL